ncbi:MAG: U32 family peptidase [Firmicutes bacterium]|nr:U32 family peptidase [Bacillota bacterium]
MKTKHRIPELLAPVGGRKQFWAAVNNGADAVYLGGSRFNARQKADNFGADELREVIAAAHERDVKIYVTLNTLLKDRELPDALEYAGFLWEAGADGVILQDMGLSRLIHETLPEFPMHLSTQGTVYNPWALDLTAEMGFSRIVPARELTLEEVRAFTEAAHAKATEVEVFIHGALCMCYSGQCQMSRILGGGSARSANRGLCAQPCRLPYRDDRGRTSYLLSPRDLCLLEELPALCEAGVDSLKIEGRLKSPEYVAITTFIYRKYLDLYAEAGEVHVSPQDLADLRQIYSRGEFTRGFLYGDPGEDLLSGKSPKHTGVPAGKVSRVLDERVKDPDLRAAVRGAARRGAALVEIEGTRVELAEGDSVEIRGSRSLVTYRKELSGGLVRIGDIQGDVRPGDKVYRMSSAALMERARATFEADDAARMDRLRSKRIPVSIAFAAEAGQPARLTVSDGAQTVTVLSGEPAQEARTRPTEPDRIREQMCKLGNTPFASEMEEVAVSLGEKVMVPVSVMNSMRREAVDRLLEERRANRRAPAGDDLAAEVKRLREEAGPKHEPGAEEILRRRVPLEAWMEGRDGVPEIFPVSKGRLDAYIKENFEEIAARAKETGIIAGNLGWIRRFLDAGVTVYGAGGLNVMNEEARIAFAKIGVRVVEDSWEKADGGVPLMILEHPVQSKTLTDRKGVVHRVERAPSGDKTVIR